MRKEVIIAITFGLIVGLIITIGMYRARTALEVVPTEDTPAITQEDASPLPSSKPQTQTGLILREPAEDALSTTQNTLVSGTTFANRAIVILLNEKEVVAMSDEQGNFSIPVSLGLGANLVKVRVLNPQANPIEVTRTIVYELPLGALTQASASSTLATTSAKSKR